MRKRILGGRRIEPLVVGSILLPDARSIMTLSGASRYTRMNIQVKNAFEKDWGAFYTNQHVLDICLSLVMLKFVHDSLENQLKSNHDDDNQNLSNVLHIIQSITMMEYCSID